MQESLQTNSVEERRKLLKGALAGSVVMTLGYGGAAAAASLTCMAKTIDSAMTMPQLFHIGSVPPVASAGHWAYKFTPIFLWQNPMNGSEEPFEACQVGNFLYKVIRNPAPPALDPTQLNPFNYRIFMFVEPAYVLAFFDANGVDQGAYPTYTQLVPYGPAAKSCYASFPLGTSPGPYFFSG